MIWGIIALLLNFIQDYIATSEVYNISQARARKAATYAGLNELAGLLNLIILIDRFERKIPIMIGSIIGNVLATYMCVKRHHGKKCNQ